MKQHTNEVRRKLLKAVIYAPPVILGTMMATPRSVMGAGGGTTKNCASAGGGSVLITISSGTNACCPCIPTAKKYDPVLCNEQRCLLSCGTNCAPGVIGTIKCKDFCKTCGTTPSGCNKPCTCTGTKCK